jgi:hypothetical protein
VVTIPYLALLPLLVAVAVVVIQIQQVLQLVMAGMEVLAVADLARNL